ncbi:MAG: lipocalin family protein, partial [Rikenellaceae bacterium]
EYSICDNNIITVINRGFNTQEELWKEAHGKGEPTSTQGRFKVSFFLFFSSEYNVLGIGDEYEWALVGTKSSKFLWILSRTPTLMADTLRHIISLAEQRGYDIEKLNIIQREDMALR